MDASQPPLVGTVTSRGPVSQSLASDDAYQEAGRAVTAAIPKAEGRRHVHFAPTNQFVEPEESPTSDSLTSTLQHTELALDHGHREPMLAAVSPQEVVIEYNRAVVWRWGIAVTLLALPLLYFTPIVGLLLVFPCAHCVYWVHDRTRFHGGGDARGCSNRDCALVTGVLGIFSAFAIDVINVICLIVYLDETPVSNGSDSTLTTEGTGAPVAAMTTAERDLRRLELAWGVMLVPVLALLLRHLHRLRHVLSAIDARSQDLVTEYV